MSDVGNTEHGAPYMVMELLNGKDLEGVLEERGPLSYAEAVDYLLQACEAVAEAHHLGIVHRDLKPANLFLATVAGCPCVKVLDFGVAKVLNAKLTTDGATMGSPNYMPPEQLQDASTVDTRCDIWALGVILYQLVTARLPFESDTLPGLCAQLFAQPPIPLGTRRTDAPPGFEAVILRCLEKDRERRIQSVAEFANAIAPFGSAATAAYPARIAAAGGGPLSRQPALSAPSGQQSAQLRTTSATTGSPMVARGGPTLTPPSRRSNPGPAIMLALSVLSLGGAGAIYVGARRAASSPMPSASVVATAEAPIATGKALAPTPLATGAEKSAGPAVTATAQATTQATASLPATPTSTSAKRAVVAPIPQRPSRAPEHLSPAAPQQPNSVYAP